MPDTNWLSVEEKIKILMQFDEEFEGDRAIDPEEDFFALGMLEMHGLITEDLQITEAGEKRFWEMLRDQYYEIEE